MFIMKEKSFICKKQFVMMMVLPCMALSMQSCADKAIQHPIKTIESLCETLEQDWDYLTDADFEEIAEEYEMATEQIAEYSDCYTQEEKREILRLQGRFYGIMAKKMENAMQGALDELDSWAEEADCFSEGFDEGYDE